MKNSVFSFLIFSLFTTQTFADDAVQMERIHWEKEIKKATTLVFKNHYGNIRLRSTDDQMLVFHGVAQHSQKHRIKLDFDEQSDQIIAEVVFADAKNMSEKHRLDAVIIVPSTLNLDIEFENGELSSKGLKSAVKARSVNGNISIKSNKNVDLFSQNGDVTFYAKAAKDQVQHVIKSHKGDVNVYFKGGTNNHFSTLSGTEASTNDIELLRSAQNKGRSVLFGEKNANQQFNLQTDTGFIRIINLKHL